MLVVADSSPLIVLINIGHVGILSQLFQQVFIPPQIVAELSAAHRPQAVRDFIQSPPAWLIQQAPLSIESISALHEGELAAISLARELHADLLLIDEIYGRRAATQRKIPFT